MFLMVLKDIIEPKYKPAVYMLVTCGGRFFHIGKPIVFDLLFRGFGGLRKIKLPHL